MSISELSDEVPFSPRLDHVPLLSLMPEDVRRLVMASFVRESFAFGEVIVAEGDDADAMYVLLSGHAEAVAEDGTATTPMQPGDAGTRLRTDCPLRCLDRPGGHQTPVGHVSRLSGGE